MPDSISDTSASLPPENSTDTAEGAVLAAPLAQTFAELKLSPLVLESLNKAGFSKPTPIQSQFIPLAMTGQDVMGQAKTGTGKTAAFLLPIFEAIKPGAGKPQALILAPTRELALQIHGEIGRLGSFLGFASITLYGGASYEPQIEALSSGVDIVVGTPGRIMDHMRSQRLDLTDIKVAVLDEADRMLDLGFRKDIEYILRHCPTDRQTLLLSATIPDDIKKLAQRFMYDPLEVWTSPENLTVDTVEQSFFVCERDEKFPILLKLLEVENPDLSIIFCGTKMGAKRLAEKLKRVYINAREIHGDLQQSRREKILGRFRTGEVKLLIATDVASRGIDVQNITHIINWDIPYKIEDYVHRIGRTGRIGRSGKAFTFVTREEGSYLTEIELLINKEIKRMHFDDLTSKWWPNPPKEPPPEFIDEGPEKSIASASGDKRGGGRKRRRRGRGDEDRPVPRSHGRTQSQAPAAGEVSAVVEGEAAAVSNDGSGSEAADAGGAEGGERKRSRRRRRSRGEPVQITCSQCGTSATVNFKPEADRPVYCPACYQARKAAKAAAQPADGAGDAQADTPTS
ncbi:MAG TPA: DEAD/DEAH box helicase [Planctomycetota bacterium]|nr:DEAD/DEAH box helicase [Planctomycetota bacterium]